MKPRTAIACVLLTLILLLAACAPNTTPPEAAPEPGAWRIIPTGLSIEPAAGGGQHVTIDLAFENGTGEFSTKEWDVEGSTLVGQEGESYPLTAFDPAQRQPGLPPMPGERSTVGATHYALPPGFRARGIHGVMIESGMVIHLTEHRHQLLADIGGDTQPVKVMIPDYGELDLEREIADLAFPGNARGPSTHKVGDTIEVPGKAKLTVSSVSREPFEHVGDFGEFDRVTAHISYGNLTDSYDDTFRIQFSLIGDDGLFYEVYSDTMVWHPTPRLRAGAGETMTTEVWYPVPRATKDLQLILVGSVAAVFDTGL
jgi:hypothetical protein